MTTSIVTAGNILSECLKSVVVVVSALAALAIVTTQPAAADEWRHFHGGFHGQPHFHYHDGFIFRGAFFPGPVYAPVPVVVGPAPYYGYVPFPAAYAPAPIAYAPAPYFATPSINVVVPLHIH